MKEQEKTIKQTDLFISIHKHVNGYKEEKNQYNQKSVGESKSSSMNIIFIAKQPKVHEQGRQHKGEKCIIIY